jgi:hypothetical protein
MLRYFMGTKSRATIAYETFVKWVNSYRLIISRLGRMSSICNDIQLAPVLAGPQINAVAHSPQFPHCSPGQPDSGRLSWSRPSRRLMNSVGVPQPIPVETAVHSRGACDGAAPRLADGVDRDLPQAYSCIGVEGIGGDAKGARSTGGNDGCFVAVLEVTSADALEQR